MSADNLRIWNALSKTDPKHTKPFSRAGGFKGTATKPIWLTMRLTEKFGPCGIGWGMGQPEFQTVTAGDEILVFCTVALWYREGEALGTVYGVGGDKVLGKNKYGPFTNDEAFKASYTDALSNAMKQIGVAADIHMGLFEDQKYLREVTQEFAEEQRTPAPPPSPPPGPSSANGRRMAAAEPQLVDTSRPKGTMPGAGNGPLGGREATAAEARAAKIKANTDMRVNALKAKKDWTRPALDDFWHDNAVWIDWMSDPNNKQLAEYERFSKAFADAEMNLKQVELA